MLVMFFGFAVTASRLLLIGHQDKNWCFEVLYWTLSQTMES